MYVTHRFVLTGATKDRLREMTPKFGYDGFGEAVFYRTYSRQKKDGGQENWADVVIRCTEGTFSIRKDWYLKNRIHWDEAHWQEYAADFAISFFLMHWMPPGRGLWAMGSDFVYERGAMALYNCAATLITDDFSDDLMWLMDSLMHGVGVGFGPLRSDRMELYAPSGSQDYIIEDTRESWVESVGALCDAYRLPGRAMPRFIYDRIRPAGVLIKGFGGVASGPGPLKHLHESLVESFESYRSSREYDSVRLKTDLANKVGCCVVSGNVRRSAEMACASVRDKTFLDLKNYEKFPERASFGWMSNNSVILESDSDFEMLGEIANRVKVRGEPGYINMRNIRYGRIGKRERVRRDRAVLFNPCGEIPLEHREVCNVCETLPTVCPTIQDWYAACGYATMYCSTVSLLPTHQPSTNRVVARNRRIGVSIIDVSGWKHTEGVNKVTHHLRAGYRVVCDTNRDANAEAGVPEAIRKTTIKPGGTTPKVAGRTPGMRWPNFDYMIARMRCQENSPFDRVMMNSGYPRERDVVSRNTVVIEFPLKQGPAKPASQVTVWEQAMTLVWLQREWADNAVSNTLNFRPKWPKIAVIRGDFEKHLSFYTDLQFSTIGFARGLLSEKRDVYETEEFRIVFNYAQCRENGRVWKGDLESIDVHQFDPKHEEDDLEPVLAAIAPLTKSVSLLPQSTKGTYPQMPEEGIDQHEYLRRLGEVDRIDWTKFRGSDGEDERYCDGPKCEITNDDSSRVR